MKKFSYLFLILSGLLMGVTSCNNDDDDNPSGSLERPSITVPTGSAVQVGQTITLAFNVNAPGKIASLSVEASAGTATVANQSDMLNQTTGTVNVTYVAPETAGTHTVTLTVTDAQNPAKSESQVATVNVNTEPAGPSEITINTGAAGIADVEGYDAATSSYTMVAGITYILDGFVFVQDGQTLNIEAGTVIKGLPGQGGGASALIVSRGGKIMAEGTAEAPIIMTGFADNLQGSVPDDVEGLWGGLIILGRSVTNNIAQNNEKAIEGLPTDGLDGDPMYGGNDTEDNSGVIRYVSIRHGGSLIGGDNEINGLTLGAVGSGTTLEYIEVWSNLDDGIEWFGGTAQIKYVVSSWIGDDAFDYDEGFTGKVQYGLVWSNEANVKDDSWGGEHDGGVGANEGIEPYALPEFYNITYIGDAGLLGTILFRDNSGGEYHNSIFSNYENGVALEIRTDIQSSYDRLVAGDLKLQNNIWHNVSDGTPGNIFTIITGGTVSDAERIAAETYFTNYFATAGNVTSDPELTGVVPAANEAVTTGLSTYPDDGFFDQAAYKGAFEPGAEPWIAGWTKTWQVLNK